MRIETPAVHAGCSPDPTTQAVAVPIYQTVVYGFDEAGQEQDVQGDERGLVSRQYRVRTQQFAVKRAASQALRQQ